MTVMRTMGLAPVLPAEASVEAIDERVCCRLAVPGFAQGELEVEIAGRFVTVRGDQTQTTIDNGPFRLHERLEERFQLPADVDTDEVTAALRARIAGAARPAHERRSGKPRRVPIEHPCGDQSGRRRRLREEESCRLRLTGRRPRRGEASPQAFDRPVDGDRIGRRQHGRLRDLHAAGRTLR